MSRGRGKKRKRHSGYRKRSDPKAHRPQWPKHQPSLDQPFYLWELGLTRDLPPERHDRHPLPPVIRRER